MINKQLFNTLKINELNKDNYYILYYDEKMLVENPSYTYEELEEIYRYIKNTFPDLKFVLVPQYIAEIKEVLNKEQLQTLLELFEKWINKNDESN